MKLIVGLGNPGRKYDGTRHNIGFVVLDVLAAKYGKGAARQNFQADVVEADLAGERALLIKPITFMNRSGSSVLAARDFYKVPLEDVLVICDDFHLPLAKLRFRPSGSSGGQKGLEDVVRRLGSEQVPRLRVGVGEPPAGQQGADFVLGRFRKEEQTEMEIAAITAAEAVVTWATQGIAVGMNRFNGSGS